MVFSYHGCLIQKDQAGEPNLVQPIQTNEKVVVVQDVVFNVQDHFYPASRVSDSLGSYRYICRREYSSFHSSLFINVQTDVVENISYRYNPIIDTVYSTYPVHYQPKDTNCRLASAAAGTKLGYGLDWLKDIFYSDVLNAAGIVWTENHIVLKLDPEYIWDDTVAFKILELMESENGLYLDATIVRHRGNNAFEIVNHVSSPVPDKRHLDRFEKSLSMVNREIQGNLESVSGGKPELIVLPNKRLLYSVQYNSEPNPLVVSLIMNFEKLYGFYAFK